MDRVCRYKFLVIDDKDIWGVHNLTRKVNQAIKHPEPVLRLDAPWHRDNDSLGQANVIYDEDERLFKMWYTVDRRVDKDAAVIVEYPVKLAYATSSDGVHWERPRLGLVEFNGSRENNYLIPEMGFYGYTLIHDPSDIAARKYKMIFGVLGRESEWARFHIPLSLAYSADGIHWDRPTHVNPIIRGISDGCLSLFYDADRRKYVLLTRRVPNLPRDISQYESTDLVNWEDKGRVLVAGDEHDPPEMNDVYFLAPFRYEDFYLGMLPAMYTLPGAESYESYNKSPQYPNDTLGHLEIQLTISRDGRTWSRPLDRSPVIPCGQPGDPDFGAVCPSLNPIVVNGEAWIYYQASRTLHCWWHEWEQDQHGPKVRDRHCVMLAKMPEDGWVSLDGDGKGGWLTTDPWGPPHEVFVNADVDKGGRIEAELVTPYGEPVPDFTRADCIPVTGKGKDQQIKWKCGRHPWDFQKNYLGGVLVKFHVTNAKLYSYTFTLPDPTGQLERDRLNARWCEMIKHRSDNWGRASTEPPIGEDARQRMRRRMKSARPYEQQKGGKA